MDSFDNWIHGWLILGGWATEAVFKLILAGVLIKTNPEIAAPPDPRGLTCFLRLRRRKWSGYMREGGCKTCFLRPGVRSCERSPPP